MTTITIIQPDQGDFPVETGRAYFIDNSTAPASPGEVRVVLEVLDPSAVRVLAGRYADRVIVSDLAGVRIVRSEVVL